MYKNVIFDLGGVVVDWTPRDFLMDHFMNRRVEDMVYDLTFGSQEWYELDRGTISRGAANRNMLDNAARCGRTFEVQAVLDSWETILKTKNKTVKTMCQLKLAGCRLYYLSNIAEDTMELIRQRDFFPIFDGGVASYEVHVNKPDPKIYTHLMQKYHLAYDESVFVDDNKQNAQAAYDLGITGIMYKNAKSFNRALHLCGFQMPQKGAHRAPTPAKVAKSKPPATEQASTEQSK